MTRTIQWIDDAGALYPCATIGQFADPVGPTLTALSFSQSTFTLGVEASGAILGATSGSTVFPTSLPTGISINPSALTWEYDGTGGVGTSPVDLTEALIGSPNSPNSSVFDITISAPVTIPGIFDLSQPGNPLIAAIRSF